MKNDLPNPVAVCLMSVPCQGNELDVLRALTHLTGDFEAAFKIALGDFKGSVGGPVSAETATVIVRVTADRLKPLEARVTLTLSRPGGGTR